MNYWLFKSEPSSWSWQDQLKKGEKGEGWDGVRNYQASNNMKKMKILSNSRHAKPKMFSGHYSPPKVERKMYIYIYQI